MEKCNNCGKEKMLQRVYGEKGSYMDVCSLCRAIRWEAIEDCLAEADR